MSTTIKIRRDTAARWATNNPTPASSELCIVNDITPQRIKIGDGVTPFNSLPYFTLPNATITEAGLMSAADKAKLNGITSGAIDMSTALDVAAMAQGMAVLVTFDIVAEGDYMLCAAPELKFMGIGRKGYKDGNCHLAIGQHVVAFVFEDALTIPARAFKGVAEAIEVHIPSWVHTIGSQAFAETSLTKVYCEAMTPPAVEADAFDDPASLEAVVHKVVQAEYQATTIWEDFSAINTF